MSSNLIVHCFVTRAFPTLLPKCWCFESPTSKFLDCASGSDGVLGRHKGLYWFGRNVPTSSSLLLVLPTLKVYSRGYKRTREGKCPKSLMCGCVDVFGCLRCLRRIEPCLDLPFMRCPASPFIVEGEEQVTE